MSAPHWPRTTAACSGLLGIGLALGCALAPSPLPEESTGRAAGAAQHAVHDARLSQLMEELARLSLVELPRGIDSQAAFQRRRRELVDVAEALAQSSGAIQRAAAALELTPPERQEFLFLAETLRRRAATLAVEAPYASLSELHERSVEIRHTCDHCHGRYRAPLDGAGG